MEISQTIFQACEILDVSPRASDTQIRQAYLEKLKLFPPDRDPQNFERIQGAYEMVKDPRKRAEAILFHLPPIPPILDLLPSASSTLPFTGPDPWIEVLKEE